MSIFTPSRKNRHIFQGAISLIYWPILTNLGIKLIVSTRQIQWNNLQSNILKNKDFQFFVSFAHKNQFSHNFPSYLSAEKIRKNLFWSFCTYSCLKWSDIGKKVPNPSALIIRNGDKFLLQGSAQLCQVGLGLLHAMPGPHPPLQLYNWFSMGFRSGDLEAGRGAGRLSLYRSFGNSLTVAKPLCDGR